MEQNESKNIQIRPPQAVVAAVVIFLAVVSIFFLVKIYGEYRGYNRLQPAPSVTVSGEGKKFVKPDIGTISVGVMKSAIDLQKARSAADDVMNRVGTALKDKGIADKDQKQTSYNIAPQYDWKDGQRIFRGYEVSETLEVKIRDLAKVGEILAAVTAAGANEVGSLSFDVDDSTQVKAEARADAIKEAKEKAAVLASQLGVRLGKIVSYSASEGGVPPPIYARAEFGIGGAVPALAPVPVGQNEIDVSVLITYELK